MTELRALTVRQPYADLIVAGVKDVENRSRPPTWWDLPQYYGCLGCGSRYCPRGDGVPRPVEHHPGEHWLPSGLGYGARTCGRWEPEGPYPFRLAIHAAQKQATNAHAWAVWQKSMGAQRGVILGTVEVVGSHHADEDMLRGRKRGTKVGLDREGRHVSRDVQVEVAEYRPCSEWAEPDCHHWQLSDPRLLDDPTPATGQQGLWRLDTDVADQLRGVAV